MEFLLFCVAFATLSAFSHANPLPKETISKRRDLSSTIEQWRGIHWDVAADECDPAHFDILVEATRMAVMITNYQTDMIHLPFYSAAWHRFFVDDSEVISGLQGTWHGVSPSCTFNWALKY